MIKRLLDERGGSCHREIDMFLSPQNTAFTALYSRPSNGPFIVAEKSGHTDGQKETCLRFYVLTSQIPLMYYQPNC